MYLVAGVDAIKRRQSAQLTPFNASLFIRDYDSKCRRLGELQISSLASVARRLTPKMSIDYISLSRQAKAFIDELPPNPDDALRQVTPPHMSQYPPPSEAETVAYSTPSYPPAVPPQDTSNSNLGYTPPGNPIDPN